jgi:pimeloyl-ACP methyl ester carboxylesterase
VLTSLGGRSVVQINADRLRAVAPQNPPVQAAEGAPAAREKIQAALRGLLALPAERTPLEPAVLSTTHGQGLVIEEFVFHSEPAVRIPGWFVKPEGKSGPLRTVLYVSEHGRDGAVHETGELYALARQGHAVCAIDLRGLGISTPHYPPAGPLFYGYDDPDIKSGYAWACLTLGKPVLGQRVWDFLRTLDYLETRPDVDRASLAVYGVGGGGLAALMGSTVDDRPRSVLLEGVPADFASVVESEYYSLQLPWFVFGLLRQLDVPVLVAALAPRPCWLFNATGPASEVLPELAVENRYQDAAGLYSALGSKDKLRILVQPDQERATALADWLGRS